MPFEGRDAALAEIPKGLILTQGSERIHDRNVDVVVIATGFDRRFRQTCDLLVTAGRKERTAQDVVASLTIAFAFDGFLHHGYRFIVFIVRVEDPCLADLDFGQIRTQDLRGKGTDASGKPFRIPRL